MINQELLRTFVAAAESPTFREAARLRHVTKSAVSQQIKALETQLGVPLFERVGRQALLTEEGRALRDVLKREFEVIDEALEALISAQHVVKGEVCIGSPRPFARIWLRPRLNVLLREHPALRVRVRFGTASELEPALAARELDFALLAREPTSSGIVAERIYEERFHAYAAPSYLRAHGTPRTLEEFARQRYIVFDDDLAMHADWWRAQFGPRATPRGELVCKIASLDEMLALAEAGLGVAVLPDYFAARALARRSLVTLAGKRARTAQNHLYLAYRRHAIAHARFQTVRAILRP